MSIVFIIKKILFIKKEGIILAYRKRKGSDTWHWCSHCSKWPAQDYDFSSTKPNNGKFCHTCLELVNKNNCN